MRFVAAAVLFLSLQGGRNDVDSVVQRASVNLDAYLRQLGSVVGEEQYNQEAAWKDAQGRRRSVTSHRERRMTSDFLTVPVGQDWIGIRHVRKVDDVTLDPLYRGVWREAFDESTPEGRSGLQEAFNYESTRYNIGDINRSTNVPTFPLELLDPSNLNGLIFSKGGEEKLGSIQTWKIRFRERAVRSFVMATATGPAERLSLSGVFWIEPSSGRVFRAQVEFSNPLREKREMQMDVRFRMDPAVELLVPDAMEEHYEDGGWHEIHAHAQYFNYRRFGSAVQLQDILNGSSGEEAGDLKRDGDEAYSVKVNVRVVNVEAWVTAVSGSAVTDLTPGDFNLRENNVEQSITNFSPVSTPYDVLLLFDQSGSTRDDWVSMQRAAERFISSARPQDRVGIAIFNSSFRMLTRWTNTREQLSRTVADLTKPRGGGGTAFYRAVEMSLASEMLPVAGRRRAIVILTDGRDNLLLRHRLREGFLPAPAQDSDYQRMIRLARRERVPIYTVTISNPGSEVADLKTYYSAEAASEYLMAVANRLELLSETSGGRVIFPRKFEDIISLYGQISRELSSAYSIGYVSNIPLDREGFREITLTTHDPRLHVVQSRPGYAVP